MTLEEIARALDGTLNGEWINIPGPGHSRSDLSLGIIFDQNSPDGFRLNPLAPDDRAECRAYVHSRLRAVAEKGVGPILTGNREETAAAQRLRVAMAMQLWDEALPAVGSLVEDFLAARGCPLAVNPLAADALRFHPLCPFGSTSRFAAMIALVRNVLTDQPTGIHRTALREDGKGKREMPDGLSAKMAMGAVKGGAVKLSPIAGPRLGIAEGIESALSASQKFDVPVWAALSAGGVRAFPIVQGISRLIAFADHDDAGLKAGKECAERYSASGIDAAARYPTKPNTDWND